MLDNRHQPARLTRHRCMNVLAAGQIGRVAVSVHALPTIVSVRYRVHDDAVQLHVLGDHLEYAPPMVGQIVCFQHDLLNVDGRSLTSIRVVGRAQRATLDPADPTVIQQEWLSLDVSPRSGNSLDGDSLPIWPDLAAGTEAPRTTAVRRYGGEARRV